MMVMARVGRPKVAAPLSVVRDIRLITGAFSLAMLLYIFAHPIFIPAEAALNLQCGMLIAKGQVPYKDFLELAAPALQYLNVIPALVARIVPLHPAFLSRLFAWALYTLSTGASAYILLKAKSRDQRVLPWFVVCYAAVPFFFLDQFGQAQQLFVFLYMPYLVVRWLRWSGSNGSAESNSTDSAQPASTDTPASETGNSVAIVPLTKRQAIICGAIGAYAAALDPLFLIAFVAMELYFFLDKQRKAPLLAPEFLSALAVTGLSVVVAFLFGDDYVRFALPIMFYDYKHWDDRLIYVYKTPDRRDLVYLMVALTTLALAFKKRCSLIAPLSAFSIAGFGLWIIPGEAFTQQAFLMLYGCLTAGSLALGSLVNQLALFLNRWFPVLANVSRVVTVGCIGGLLLACYFLVESLDRQRFIDFRELNYICGISPRSDLGDFSELLEVQTIPGDKVLILSDKDRPASPLLVQMNREPGSFLLTGTPMRVVRRIFEREPLEIHQPFIKPKERMYERLAQDIRKNRPKLILVDFDSVGDLLEMNGVMTAVNELYETGEPVDWITFAKLHPPKEYLGFQNPFRVYHLKGLKLPVVVNAPGVDPEVTAVPKPPEGTPGLPAQTPAPGPLAPGALEQKPSDNVTIPNPPTSAPPAKEQAPSPVANPIRI